MASNAQDQHAVEVIRRAIGLARGLPANQASSTDYSQLDDYEFLREIARGGQGIVYLARRRNDSTAVAIKALHSIGDRRSVERLKREARILKSIAHPAITACHEIIVGDTGAYLIMDYIEGVSFATILEEAARRELPADRYLSLLGTLAAVSEALASAHDAGVIHRDIKPSNIRIDDSGQAHLIDFGLAVDASAGGESLMVDSLTDRGQFVGSLLWASPEQLKGEPVDTRTDIWSLGLILHQLLSRNAPPFSVRGGLRALLSDASEGRIQPPRALAPGLRELGPEFESAAIAIVGNALAPNRADRTASARELGDQIAALAGGRPAAVRAPLSRTLAVWTGWAISLGLLGVVIAIIAGLMRDSITPAPDHTKQLISLTPGVITPVDGGYSLLIDGNLVFRWIPAGEAVLGVDPSIDRFWNTVTADSPLRTVRFDHGFWMARYEVWQSDFERIVGSNPSRFVGPELPADSINYAEAIGFCSAASDAYGVRFRLPTSDEWEYACRAGATGLYSFGSDPGLIGRYANAADLSNPDLAARRPYDDGFPTTARPGSFLQNEFGLNDMHGNVWEWCAAPYLADPRDPSSAIPSMADTRGGSYHDGPGSLEAGHRNPLPLDSRVSTVGFRVIVEWPAPD